MKLSWRNVFCSRNLADTKDRVCEKAVAAGYPFFAFNDGIFMIARGEEGYGCIETGLTLSANKDSM
jgi:hypothetical protein